jgi:hypothetical protein
MNWLNKLFNNKDFEGYLKSEKVNNLNYINIKEETIVPAIEEVEKIKIDDTYFYEEEILLKMSEIKKEYAENFKREKVNIKDILHCEEDIFLIINGIVWLGTLAMEWSLIGYKNETEMVESIFITEEKPLSEFILSRNIYEVPESLTPKKEIMKSFHRSFSYIGAHLWGWKYGY